MLRIQSACIIRDDWSRSWEGLINLTECPVGFLQCLSSWTSMPLYYISGNWNWDTLSNKSKCHSRGRKRDIWNWSFLRNCYGVIPPCRLVLLTHTDTWVPASPSRLRLFRFWTLFLWSLPLTLSNPQCPWRDTSFLYSLPFHMFVFRSSVFANSTLSSTTLLPCSLMYNKT